MATETQGGAANTHKSPQEDGEGSVFDKLAATVDESLQRPFRRLGYVVGSNPWKVIAAVVVVCLILSTGLGVLVSEDRADELWIPQDTTAKQDQDDYEANFPRTGAIEYVICEANTPEKPNILDQDVLLELLDIHEVIYDIEIKGGKYSLPDLCIEANPTDPDPCFLQNILAAWAYNRTKLELDSNIVNTVNTYFDSSDLGSLLGGDEVYDDDGDITSARAAKMTYFLKDDTKVVNNQYVSPRNERWERKFLNKMHRWNKKRQVYIKTYPEAQTSWADEFLEALSGDILLVNIAFAVMIFYLSMNIGRQRPCEPVCPNVGSRILVSLVSVFSIVLAMLSGFGFCSYLGYEWAPIHQVLPFVILGLGVDDSFVIANAFDRTPRHLPIPVRMQNALGHAATSVTITSLTDFVAFAISTQSALPALSSFCLYAAISILFLFFIQITFFAAGMALDEQRQMAGKMDVIPCCTNCCVSTFSSSSEDSRCCCRRVVVPTSREEFAKEENSAPHQGGISRFLENTYCPTILNPAVKPLIIVAYLALLGTCIWGATNLTVESSERSFVPDGSYLLKTYSKEDNYFGGDGAEVYIVTKDVDYFANQANLAAMKDDVAGNKYLLDPYTTDSYDSWYDAFIEHCNTPANNCSSDFTTDEESFYTELRTFLNRDGSYYNDSVVFDSPTNIIATRIETQYVAFSKSTGGREDLDAEKAVKAMKSLRDEDWSVPSFPWTYEYLFWETFTVIYEELFVNVSLCLAAVFVITLLLIGHPLCSSMVFLCVTMTIVDILGCMYFWDLVIDNISVIQTVIAIGLCVDYAAHVGHSFMTKHGTRDERVTQAMADIGAAVLNGAFSTFLAVVLLAGSKSYVFRVFFQQFFLTVVLGLGHGMMLLPVLLSYIGPRAYPNMHVIDATTDENGEPVVKADLEMVQGGGGQ